MHGFVPAWPEDLSLFGCIARHGAVRGGPAEVGAGADHPAAGQC